MNRQTPQSRKIGKILIFVMLIINCYLLGICFSKISNEKDVYKIRVFDVITKNEIHEFKGYYYDYTNENIDFEIVAYCNEKEMYRTTLINLIKSDEICPLLEINQVYKELISSEYSTNVRIPKDKGWYFYEIKFNQAYYHNYNYLHESKINKFYFEFYIDYNYVSKSEVTYD